MPRYHHAVYGGESVVLENRFLRLELHKRNTGWGWGELYVAPQGAKPDRLYAILEHLGEADLEGLPHPMRLEAQAYQLERQGDVQELRFDVAIDLAAVPRPDQAFSGESPLSGTLVLTLADDEPVIGYRLEVQAQHLIYLKRLRGAWLRVGAESFGEARTDAIFPGIDWIVGNEWSSGTDWFEEHQALRMTPHPHKVAIPVMARNVLESVRILSTSTVLFAERCIDGIEPNTDYLRRLAESSPSIVTPLNSAIGYEEAARVAKHALAEGVTIREAVIALGFVPDPLSEDELDRRLDVLGMAGLDRKR